jgi:ankyrin repeat protein
MTTSNSLNSPAVLSPLHAACHVNNEEVVSLLLRAGAKTDLRSVPVSDSQLLFLDLHLIND